jgi:hypothetical protein
VKKLHPVEFIVAAMVLFGLVTGLRLPRLQGQNKIAGMAKVWAPSSGVTSSTQNPLQIGILHWYNANQTANFAVGSGPYSAAFDGLHIWVANSGSNNVTELRVSDGYPAGTFTVGNGPFGIAPLTGTGKPKCVRSGRVCSRDRRI